MNALPLKLGPYEILEELGRGTTGIVFKARDSERNRVVALKTIVTQAGDDGNAQRQRFFRGVHCMAAMAHPNIVAAYQIGEIDGHAFCIREFVEGNDLRQQIQETPLAVGAAVKLTETLARATHHMHERGIIHRNLTLENVLLTNDGSPKIIGFGRAKAFLPERPASTDNPATDVQALGTVLYTSLMGRPSLPKGLSQLPGDRAKIYMKCSEAGRYSSAAELAEDLHVYLSRKGS